MDCFGWTPEELLRQRVRLEELARRLAVDESRAQDLVQEAFVSALRASGKMVRSPAAWMAQVLRRRAIQERRQDERRRARQERAAVPDRDDPRAREAHFAVLRAVVEAVDELQEPYRSTVLMRYFEGLAPRQIVERTGTPLRTVNTRLARGLRRLRARLDGEHGGERGAWATTILAFAGRSEKAGVSASVPALVAFAIAAAVGVWVGLASRGERSAASPHAIAAAAAEEREGVLSAESDAARRAVETAPPSSAEAAAPEVGAAVALSGRVVDSAGRPVGGAEIRFLRPDAEDAKAERTLARSGPDGTFAVDEPFFEASGEGFSGRILAASERYAPMLAEYVPSQKRGPLELVVEERRTVRGLVLDETGRALEGARILFQPPETLVLAWSLRERIWFRMVPEAHSGPDGRFEIADAYAAPEARLEARHPDPDFALRTVTLEGRGPWEVELVIERRPPAAGELRGAVETAGGEPVHGALVVVDGTFVEAGDDGRWRLRWEADEPPRSLRAFARGRLPAVDEPENLRDRERSLHEENVLVLGPEALAIEGRLLDAGGEPVEGYELWVLDPTPLALRPSGAWIFAEEVLEPPRDDRTVFRVESDATGAFRIPGLLERDYVIAAMNPETLSLDSSAPVPAGTDDLVLTVGRPDPLFRFGGRVSGARGDPLAGIRIALHRPLFSVPIPTGGYYTPMDQFAETWTDGDGVFAFGKPYSAVCSLAVVVQGDEPILIRPYSEPDPENLEIVIDRRVQVEVVLGSEAPPATGLVFYGSDGANVFMSFARDAGVLQPPVVDVVPLGEDGRTGLLLVPESAVELRLFDGAKLVGTYPVHLRAGAPQTIHL